MSTSKSSKIIRCSIAVVLIACLLFVFTGCGEDIYKEYKVGEGTLELIKVSQEDGQVILNFKVLGNNADLDDQITLDQLEEFASKIKVDKCEYDTIKASMLMTTQSDGKQMVPGNSLVDIIFKTPDDNYKVSDGKIHIDSE